MTRDKREEFETYNWVHQGVNSPEDFEPIRPLEKRLIELIGTGSSKDLCEIGCSYGRAGIRFAQAGFRVIGIETNLTAVRKFNRFARDLGVDARAYATSVERFPLENGAWDAIVCEYTTHCMTKHAGYELLQNLPLAIRPAGYALVTVFTQEGKTFTQEEIKTRCLPPRGYLRSLFERIGWELLVCDETVELTKRGPYQIASQIIAKKPSY